MSKALTKVYKHGAYEILIYTMHWSIKFTKAVWQLCLCLNLTGIHVVQITHDVSNILDRVGKIEMGRCFLTTFENRKDFSHL